MDTIVDNEQYYINWLQTKSRMRFSLFGDPRIPDQCEALMKIGDMLRFEGYSCFDFHAFYPNIGIYGGAAKTPEENMFLEVLQKVILESAAILLPTFGMCTEVQYIPVGLAFKKTPIITIGPRLNAPWDRLITLRLSHYAEIDKFLQLLTAKSSIASHQSRVQAAAMYFPQEA